MNRRLRKMRMARSWSRTTRISDLDHYWAMRRWLTTFKGIHHDN